MAVGVLNFPNIQPWGVLKFSHLASEASAQRKAEPTSPGDHTFFAYLMCRLSVLNSSPHSAIRFCVLERMAPEGSFVD